MAVLYRANFQSRLLEECFSTRKIPYQIENGLNFYQRREVKFLLDYLRLIHNPYSEAGNNALVNILNVPNRYISKKFLTELEQYAQEQGVFLYAALKTMRIELPYVRRNVKDFIKLLEPWMESCETLKPAELIQLLREIFNYDSFITEDEVPSPDDQKIANLNQLQLAAAKYDTITAFLEYADTFEDEHVGDNQDGVHLMTIHKSKGLEFPCVFVVGLVEGILPTKRGDMEEERRICFVGISRAMKLLYLSYSHIYLGVPVKRSLFLEEILEEDSPSTCSKCN
jgi:DNA helicase-2/ATP-dependent DNA helicase PcrA